MWGVGAFLAMGVSPIYKIDGVMNQSIYVNIMQNVLFSYANEVMQILWVYQRDNDSNQTHQLEV